MTSGSGAPEPEVDEGLAPITIEVTPGSRPGEQVVAVTGEIDVATSPQLREAIERVIDDTDRLTIDLSGTTFIDSSGLGVLVDALKRARELGREGVALRGIQEPVRRVLEITGLTDLFTVEG